VVDPNDWRLTGQRNYLMGVTLVCRAWHSTPERGHAHCDFCWAKFAAFDGPDILHSGWTTPDERFWICDNCFADFRDQFGWHVEDTERLMPFFYETGEEIKAGDRVTWAKRPALVELVADTLNGDPENDWSVTELGGGVLVTELEPKLFGHVFLPHPHTDEDLVFVARGEKLQ
jgi:hypothetical protein